MADTATPVGRDQRDDILLESGTNELEVLVFQLGGQPYGINVAKVREVIQPVKVTASPGMPPSVLGMINLRGVILPLVDLMSYLEIDPQGQDDKTRRVLVTEFNGSRAGFVVDSIEHIYRMSWRDIKPAPDHDGGESYFAVTGIAEIDSRLVLMLDFESIVDHISMQRSLHINQVENPNGVDRGACRVFIAEDSRFIREIMKTVLNNSGYTRVEAFTNGADAWEALRTAAEGGGSGARYLLVTDIEMPRMDGLALTKRVKSHPVLRDTPVILFSSLITKDTHHKGSQVGADDQISKPQLSKLVELVDKWAARSTAGAAA